MKLKLHSLSLAQASLGGRGPNLYSLFVSFFDKEGASPQILNALGSTKPR